MDFSPRVIPNFASLCEIFILFLCHWWRTTQDSREEEIAEPGYEVRWLQAVVFDFQHLFPARSNDGPEGWKRYRRPGSSWNATPGNWRGGARTNRWWRAICRDAGCPLCGRIESAKS